MPDSWTQESSRRMSGYRLRRPPDEGLSAVSIKVRVTAGCFHREHSPGAYRILDEEIERRGSDAEHTFDLVEHESGPEILVYVAVATAGITLAKSVIDLVVAILKARSEGIRKGDRPAEPLELVVRRSVDERRVDDEIILRIGHRDPIEPAEVERAIREALERLLLNRKEHDKTG